jgi:hypothetical protein
MTDHTPPPRLSSLLDGIRRRAGLATRDTPLPARPKTLDVDSFIDTPYAPLLEDIRVRLVAYHRAGWGVEVNGLPCRAAEHPTGPDGYWRRMPDRSLTVTLALLPARPPGA